jgi:hypothetical protein
MDVPSAVMDDGQLLFISGRLHLPHTFLQHYMMLAEHHNFAHVSQLVPQQRFTRSCGLLPWRELTVQHTLHHPCLQAAL